MNTPRFRGIPSVQELLEAAPLRKLKEKVTQSVVVSGVSTFLDNLRRDIGSAAKEMGVPTPSELAEKIASWIMTAQQPPLRPVVNATGMVLHTGLGRAPLAEEAVHEMAAIATGYSSLEVSLESGERSNRLESVEKLLRQFTGAEAALVVNNNTAATILVLAGLARDREVIVSRGQLVEIGESFRLPEVMETSGARLREVGTTNKTRTADYEGAISDRTAAILRAPSSNSHAAGNVEEAPLGELAAVARRHSVPLIDNVGSGALIDLAKYGVPGEPVIVESIRQGADVVLFSGDKLLGGPQCGIIVGRKSLLNRIAQHALMRSFRVDKLTLAALAATLRLYLDADTAESRIPLLALLATPIDNLKLRAIRLAEQLQGLAGIAAAEAKAEKVTLGGGAHPNRELESWCVAIRPTAGTAHELAALLRQGSPSVFGRVQDNQVLLSMRSVPPRCDQDLLAAVVKLNAPKSSESPSA